MSNISRFRARAEPDGTWRIWDEKRSKFWVRQPFPSDPVALVAELNGEARPAELKKLVQMLRPDTEPATGAVEPEKQFERAIPSREERRIALAPHQQLVDDVSALLFRHDPIGINFEHNTDEYDPEADTIVLRLVDIESTPPVDELQQVVHDEFVRWFGDTAGPHAHYHAITVELQALLASWSQLELRWP